MSPHVGQLRRELGDQLFHRTAAGLAFTPGRLRLAGRSAELLGLRHAAPGLLGLFGARAADLDVELGVAGPGRFGALLLLNRTGGTSSLSDISA